MDGYGKELILDLHDCNVDMFNRSFLRAYFKMICIKIDMERCELHFWDDLFTSKGEEQTSANTKGTSAVQFILTSNITIHTLDKLEKVFVNIFSCKDFDSDKAANFTRDWFGGKIVSRTEVERL